MGEGAVRAVAARAAMVRRVEACIFLVLVEYEC